MKMTMNRRQFGTRAAAALGSAALLTTLPAMEGCDTSWIATAEADLPTIISIGTTVISVIADATGNGAFSPAAVALLQESAKELNADLQTLNDAIAAYKSAAGPDTLAKVIAALRAVQADAPDVVNALPMIGSASLTSVVTGAIGTLITLLAAIETLLPQTTTGATVPTPSTGVAKARVTAAIAVRVPVKTKIKLPESMVLKSSLNATLSVYGFGQHQIS